MRVNAERLQRARERAGLSRRELSKAIELSIPSIWRIENAGQVPDANILGRWAKACGVRVDSLYEAA